MSSSSRRRLAAVVSACVLAGCARDANEIVLSGPTMGTTYTIRVVDPPQGVDRLELGRAVADVLERIDRSMSGYRSDSEMSAFNASATTDWTPVSPELAEVIEEAQSVSARSGGAFDITIAPLVAAWGFGATRAAAEPPDAAVLAALRARVGYEKLHVRRTPPALRKDAPELSIDLNGVAPGYAVDRLAERLRSMNVERFLIELGGEVRARGLNARGERWRVAVEHPLVPRPATYAIVQLDDMAVTTSGEYRNYYVRDGRRYSHTIDPRTARPVDHDLAAVVVIAPKAVAADAWATAYNVLGVEEGYALATKLAMPVMFIERRGERLIHRMTPQFRTFVTLTGE